ncbi:hypothetical protein QR680_001299 [Steinernema hermaphroditum]|uniref:protein-tyrosine-phosphatase n=1 Tax=Steinernema hermaphroditum TaxID=289476 RepID=A0AA39GXN7_9BILA|nr:hypothetical protein QR680_001299 [Steinernema hermaphroditum]
MFSNPLVPFSTLLLLLRLIHCTPTDPPSFQQEDLLQDEGLKSPHPFAANAFAIQKDPTDPSRLLNVILPQDFHEYEQFISKVTDISPEIEFPTRDVNKTFLASPNDNSVINIHGLHAGHKYSIVILGRVGGDSVHIREESVLMDPLPLDFGRDNSSIIVTNSNVTMRTIKVDKSLQDVFRVEYSQISPYRKFPILDVNDIVEQKYVELYLGNLSPGRDYEVTVTSIREDLPSKPWKGLITTKPLKPVNLSVSEINTTCVRLSWNLPHDSGADRFKVAYGEMQGDPPTTKLETLFGQESADLCEQIIPGQSYLFAVIAEKSHQISDAGTTSHTVKPLPPIEMHVMPDFEKGKYKVFVDLPHRKYSKIDKCTITVVSEQLQRSEKTVKANVDEEKDVASCMAYYDIVPGRRYEISVASGSGLVSSSKRYKSLAVTPAFDMDALQLNFKEIPNGLQLEWPPSEVAMLRISDLWAKVVGNDSQLHLKVEPVRAIGTRRQSHQFEMNPKSTDPIVVSNLKKGACYKVSIYTVTKSGIVSVNRFEESKRMSAPAVNITVDRISSSSGILYMSKPESEENDEQSPDCTLNITVYDMHSMAVFENMYSLEKPNEIEPIELAGLRPFHKYTVNSHVTCGKSGDTVCPSKMRAMEQITFETNQDRPGPVQNVSIKALNPYSVQVSWPPPILPNGIITHYVISVSPDDEENANWTVNVGASGNQVDSVVEAVVDNLIGGLSYTVGVRAVNEAGIGDEMAYSEKLRVQMPTMAPPRPSSRIDVLPTTVHSTDLSIRYNTVMFSTKHGLLTKCAVIVAQVTPDGKLNENWIYDHENRSATWGEVQKFDVWPPYVAIETQLDRVKKFAARAVTETIGIDKTCGEGNVNAVCNGPLKPGTAYRFKLRLFTAPNLWTDTIFSEVIVTEPLQVGATFRTVFIVLALLVAFGVASLALLLCLNRRSEKKSLPSFVSQSSTHSSSSKESQWQALKMIMAERAADCLAKLGLDAAASASGQGFAGGNVSKESGVPTAPQPTIIHQNGALLGNGYGAHRRTRSLRERTGVDQRLERLPSGPPPGQKMVLYTVLKGSNIERSRPVLIRDFPDHVRLMSADSDFRFSEEYEDLRFVGNGQPCVAADMTVNRAKNRFTNILPYDHSRVKLIPTDDEDGSDYINANYMPGFNSRREFIAAQGPLPSTRDHFWRVVWQQQVPAIVALTKCVEKGRDKCHQYWPDNDQRSVLYDDIEVTLCYEEIMPEYTVRELALTNMADPTAPTRKILHMHYMAWPDFGVPEHASSLVYFVRKFRSLLPPCQNVRPTIVHCSAGVGRSGTFIALDRLVQTIPLNKPLDVFGVVHEMRMERCHMVQNEQQYIFIHQCLLYVLETEYPHLLAPNVMMGGGFAVVPPTPGIGPLGFSPLNGPKPSGFGIVPPTPRIEVHQNPAFIEDDEGIAESGL